MAGQQQAAQQQAAQRRRADAISIFESAVAACDPGRLIRSQVRLDGNRFVAGTASAALTSASRIVVVGAGKATPAMAVAIEQLLGDRIHAGLINTKHDHSLPLERIETIECSHPLPDADGVRGVQRMLQMIDDLGPDDLVVCLLSGGGSALLPMPVPPLSLQDKGDTTAALLACGASIDQINVIRKHLSGIKGGRLAQRAAPARVISLMVSDVVGDPVDTIASGPTAGDPTTFTDCLQLIGQYGISDQIPPAALQYLQQGADGRQPETPTPDDPLFARVDNIVIGNNALAVSAASAEARRRGYRPLVLSTTIEGETRYIADMHAAIACEAADSGRPVGAPTCIISGGETTVTISGDGKGGRNQEFALAASLRVQGREGITVLSCGTDGTDGPTDAAGAVADGTTVRRAADLGLDARSHLHQNNAYPFFQALGDLVLSGPTGTNVMDLRLMLVT